MKEKNWKELLDDEKRYKIFYYETMAKELFERKKYFFNMNLESVRMKFRISSHVVPFVRKNFKAKYASRTLRCPSCKDIQPMGISGDNADPNFHPSGTNKDDQTSRRSCHKNISIQQEAANADENIDESNSQKPSGSFCQQNISSHQEDYPVDTQHHLIYNCPAFRNLREGKNMGNDQHLCDFFKSVTEYRQEMNQV